MTATLLNTPGFARQSAKVKRAVADMCERNGWNPDGLIAHIEHESGWNPKIRNPNPKSTATGINQITERSAAQLGTSTRALARMSVSEQLPFVEKYFKRHQLRHGMGPWDFQVFGLGTGNLPAGAMSDDGVLYEPGSDGARQNPVYQDEDGAIRVGTVRRYLESYASKFAGRPRIPVPAESVLRRKNPFAGFWSATASGLAVFLAGRWLLKRWEAQRHE